jgi:hypothetical protein
MIRALIRMLDAFLRRRTGVFDFSDDPDSFLRLQVTQAPHTLELKDTTVQAGQPVLIIHLRNESMPRFSEIGTDLATVKENLRIFLGTLSSIARQMEVDPRLAGTRAIGGSTILLYSGFRESTARVMPRLGFTILPYSNPLGRFGEFWENFYSWLLIWTYNPGSLRFRRLLRLHRTEFWISSGEFRRRFGQKDG